MPLDCCCEQVGLCHGRGPAGRRRPWSSSGRKLVRLDVMFDRVTGLDVGKDSVTVCVRVPGPRGRRDSQTRTFKTMTRSLAVWPTGWPSAG